MVQVEQVVQQALQARQEQAARQERRAQVVQQELQALQGLLQQAEAQVQAVVQERAVQRVLQVQRV